MLGVWSQNEASTRSGAEHAESRKLLRFVSCHEKEHAKVAGMLFSPPGDAQKKETPSLGDHFPPLPLVLAIRDETALQSCGIALSTNRHAHMHVY